MKKNIFYVLIFFLFLFVFFTFYKGLNKTSTYIPNQINQIKIVEFSSKDLISNKQIFSKDYILKKKFTIINIWSSWCLPCRSEHKYLMDIDKFKNVNLIGINYKDQNINAIEFINDLGNPFNAIFIDKDGTLSIQLGAYGVPETLLINQKQEVIKKFIGPLNAKKLNEIKKILN